MDNSLIAKYYSDIYHTGVKGMRWGVRRYQNTDGTLTEAGKKRYARDAREKEFDKYDEQGWYKESKKNGRTDLMADAKRYAKEDMERTKRLTDETAAMTNKLKTTNENAIKKQPKRRADLSSMTEKEMRERINRELLERQYNDMFTSQKSNNGREYASQILETVGTTLMITSSALAIALSIKELRG